MNIAEIVAKLRKGDTLSDEEQAFADSYDERKALDAASAAGRKKAEERQAAAEKERDDTKTRLAELEKQVEEAANAGKSDTEKIQADLDKALKRNTEAEATVATLREEKRISDRNHAISGLRRKSGIKFIDGIDVSLVESGFAKAFASIGDDELADEAVTTPLVEAFKTTNKGLILDDSGGGAGTNPHDGTDKNKPTSGKPIDQLSADERADQLRKMK